MAQKILHGFFAHFRAFYKPALGLQGRVLERVPAGAGKKNLRYQRNRQRLHCNITQFEKPDIRERRSIRDQNDPSISSKLESFMKLNSL